MRRFARLLEAIVKRRAEYPPTIGDAARRAWKREHCFFEGYRAARDAIEHIDGEVTGTNRRYFELHNDYFEVVPGKRAFVNRRALAVPQQVWLEILAAADDDVRNGPRVQLLRLMHQRARQLQAMGAPPSPIAYCTHVSSNVPLKRTDGEAVAGDGVPSTPG
jgi:hypothetical protein